MDKIIKVTLGLLIALLVVFVGFVGYTVYVDTAFRSSLSSTYSYSCSITTDSVLTNVTFFIPVPEHPSGSSPVVTRIGSRDISGIPGDWDVALYGTGKSTLMKITAPKILPPAGNGTPASTTIRFTIDLRSPNVIDTINPIADSAVFRPVQEIKEVSCPQQPTTSAGSPRCIEYLTAIYASYSANPNTSLTIHSEITGRNEWKIFEPRYNEYRNTIDVLMFGDNHGWTTTRGRLESGIGSTDMPGIKS
jgi:hypothetical protein